MSPGRARTRTALSGVEHTNHEATFASQTRCGVWVSKVWYLPVWSQVHCQHWPHALRNYPPETLDSRTSVSLEDATETATMWPFLSIPARKEHRNRGCSLRYYQKKQILLMSCLTKRLLGKARWKFEQSCNFTIRERENHASMDLNTRQRNKACSKTRKLLKATKIRKKKLQHGWQLDYLI